MRSINLRALLAAVALLPLLFACTERAKEDIIPEEQPALQQSFEYRFSIAETETKAVLTDEGVFWVDDDHVGLFVAGGASTEAPVDVTTSPKTIVLSSSEPLVAGTPVYAYYPYLEGNDAAYSTTVTFPAVQEGGSLSAMPMAGIPTQIQEGEGGNGVIYFQNLGSVIDFRVFSSKYSGERVLSISFNVSEGTNPICGDASLDITGVAAGSEESLALNWPEGISAVSSLKLMQQGTVAASKEEAAEEHMYMVVAPGTYSGDFIVVTDVATYTFHTTNKVFNRNGLKRFNLDLNNAEREAWYVKINSASELVDGGKYLIVYESSSCAFKPVSSGSSYLVSGSDNVFGVTVEEGRIKATSANNVDDCQVILRSASNGNYYIQSAAVDKYFYPSGSNIAASDSPATAVSITVNNGTVNITAGSNNYFKYSTYAGYFRGSTTDSSRELALFIQESQLKRQNMHFSASSFTYITDDRPFPIGPVADAPQLTGAMTQVYYFSDNPEVAEVDLYTGELYIYGEGDATITATTKGDDIYMASSASYTITVASEVIYSLENQKVSEYIDAVEANPYDPSDSNSYIETYANGKSESNRLDLPRPVPVNWTTPTSSATVTVYKDADHTDEEIMAYVTTTTTSADIYNLIPGRRYWYVVRSGNTQIAQGSFKTSGRRRMIRVAESPSGFQYANNCRDFGGLATIDGRRIKYGKIFRGANLDRTSSNGQKNFIRNNMGVGLDVDLRYNPVQQPSNDGSYMYNGLGLDQIPQNNADIYEGHTQETYNSINDLTNSTRMGATLTRIMNAAINDVGVYIHCKVGADRTGFVCLMLESILGVDPLLCDIDYELTSFFATLDGGTYRKRKDKSQSWYYYPQGMERINQQSGATFQERAINYVMNTFGISYSKIQAFQDAMLEADPASNE